MSFLLIFIFFGLFALAVVQQPISRYLIEKKQIEYVRACDIETGILFIIAVVCLGLMLFAAGGGTP